MWMRSGRRELPHPLTSRPTALPGCPDCVGLPRPQPSLPGSRFSPFRVTLLPSSPSILFLATGVTRGVAAYSLSTTPDCPQAPPPFFPPRSCGSSLIPLSPQVHPAPQGENQPSAASLIFLLPTPLSLHRMLRLEHLGLRQSWVEVTASSLLKQIAPAHGRYPRATLPDHSTHPYLHP